MAGSYEIIPLDTGLSVGQGAVGVQYKNSQRKVLLWPDTHNYAVPTHTLITPCVRARSRGRVIGVCVCVYGQKHELFNGLLMRQRLKIIGYLQLKLVRNLRRRQCF